MSEVSVKKNKDYLMSILENYRGLGCSVGEIPDIIDGQINDEVTISEKQITSVTILIGLLLQRKANPDSLDFLPISTYINSCR